MKKNDVFLFQGIYICRVYKVEEKKVCCVGFNTELGSAHDIHFIPNEVNAEDVKYINPDIWHKVRKLYNVYMDSLRTVTTLIKYDK